LAEEQKVPFLGKIPIDMELTQCCDSGQNFLEKFPNSPSLKAISAFVNNLLLQSEQQNVTSNQ
jgi:MinD superfamily P-loop ATPase